MSVSEPTLPGSFPVTPGEGSNEPDPFIEAAKSYAFDLTEKSEHEIKDETHPAHDENVKQSNQGGGELSSSKDDRGQQLEEKERIIGASEVQVVVSATNPENKNDDENIYQDDEVIPVDPDAQSRPMDDVACEQEHEESFTEETSPSIYISNRGTGTADHNNAEPGISGSSAGALPVSEGVAEDQLLADYLGPHEPTVSAENEGNVEETLAPTDSTTPAQFEPRVRDFAVEEDVARMSINTGESDTEGESSTSATVVIDSINEPYKPHRLENIQEKTRDNRLPPLEPSLSASISSSPDASCRTGTGSVLAKFRRGRRSSSSATSKDDPSELRRSTSTPSHGDSEQDTDRSLEGIQEGCAIEGKREDSQSQKVGLMTKIKGEIKVAIGVLQRDKEKVEEGRRMIEKR
ncbi:hypothetical protein M378DRAFT_848129 [Amanita muscaria Koide BX008]|uniref:Uncharacterized protein n=1 Tax=Amanita muscaria (strain Koide BX008) TaxID=946122 RepID=A0A0C2WZ40_AMAMK|nr:hypothetical protein M378DRAFT_848129 [Amanita muscaria Koide BX008]